LEDGREESFCWITARFCSGEDNAGQGPYRECEDEKSKCDAAAGEGICSKKKTGVKEGGKKRKLTSHGRVIFECLLYISPIEKI